MGGTIFGIGPLEFVLIAVLTLLVFGPERFPELMRNLGKGVRQFRGFLASFTDDIKDDIAPIATELQEVTKDFRQDLNELRDIGNLGKLIPPISLDGAPPGNRAEQAQVPVSGEAGAPSASAPTDLAEDNPWATGQTAPTAQMDEDNPWRG